jgi:outer membrane protein assembly factor BamB
LLWLCVAAIALALVGTACWPMQGWGPGLGLNNGLEVQLSPATVVNLKFHWSAPNNGSSGSPAAVDRGTAYQLGYPISGGRPDPTLFAYDATSGAQLWATPLAPPGEDWLLDQLSPAVGNLALGGAGLVFIDINAPGGGTVFEQPSKVLALDTSNGSIVWQENFGGVDFLGSISLAPTVGLVTGGNSPALLLATTAGNLTAIEPQTGQTLWNSLPGPPFFTQPAVGNGLAYLGASTASGNQLYALDLQKLGAVKWIANIDPAFGIIGGPTVAGNLVMVGIDRSVSTDRYEAFDGATGNPRWQTNPDTGPAQAPAIGFGRAFVIEGNTIAALSLSNGAQIWQSNVVTAHTGPPSVANGVVYVPEGDQLRAVRASDGQQLDVQTVPGNEYQGEVAISDGQVLVSTNGNQGLHVYGL